MLPIGSIGPKFSKELRLAFRKHCFAAEAVEPCLPMQYQCGKNTKLPQPSRGRRLILGASFLCFSATLCAQPAFHEVDLPDAPSAELAAGQPAAGQSPDPQATAGISGTVFDINEAIVPGAQITLEPQSGVARRVETADAAAFFSFANLPAGKFKVRITARGLEAFESHEITLHAGEQYQFPKIALPVATANVDVTVTATEEEVAVEQVHDQIQQRVFAIFPNFYTSFVWNAAPLKPKQKFHLAFRAAIDPVTFFTTAMFAGIQQADNAYADYGQGAEGYAKRFGADYGDIFIGRMLGAAVFPSLLHQDPRYFYQGSGSFKSRAWHALSSAFICRGDNGRSQFNFSHILGNLAAGGISNFYRPDAERGVWLAIDNAMLHTAATATGNLVREFGLRKITHKVPAYANGKPVTVSPKP
jgi:Carboxypeptidase regulatory-like domain